MLERIINIFRRKSLSRNLREDELVILNAVREKYPEHPKDEIFFINEKAPLLPVNSSAMIQVWGNNGDGPWIHITNLAGFMADGMTIDEIKETQF
jgi:hypothetical protein